MPRIIHNKIIVGAMILLILAMSIIVPVQEAQAIIPVIIAMGELAPGIVAAMVTLIAAGLVVHTDDIAIEAAKAYTAAGQAIGTLENNAVIVSSMIVNSASTWLSTWSSTVTPGSTDIYSQAIGNTCPASGNLDWTAGPPVTLVSACPVGATGLTTWEITGWSGIQTWLEGQTDVWPDDARCASLEVTAAGWPGYYQINMYRDWIEIDWDGGFTIAMWPDTVSTVEAIRIFLYSSGSVCDVGFQVYDSSYDSSWIFPGDAPMISNVPAEGVSVSLSTDTSMPVGIETSFPLSYGPADLTVNPSIPADYTVPYPTTWDSVIDQTIGDITEPVDPPIDFPTSILDWLSNLWEWLSSLWDWIQEFWTWLKSLPQTLINLLKTALEYLFIPTAMTTGAIANLGNALMTHAPFSWVGQSFTMLQSITNGMNSNGPPVLRLPIIGNIMEFPITVGWVENIRPVTTFLIWGALLVFGYKQYRSLFGNGGGD